MPAAPLSLDPLMEALTNFIGRLSGINGDPAVFSLSR